MIAVTVAMALGLPLSVLSLPCNARHTCKHKTHEAVCMYMSRVSTYQVGRHSRGDECIWTIDNGASQDHEP